jgi:hypothetical protein
MVKFSESALKRLIKGGETTTVELKLASPRPVEMAERLCGMANTQGGVVVVGVEDSERKIVGVPDDRIAMTIDTILQAARQNIRPVLVLDPPELEVYVLDGKQVVVASVPPNKGPIYHSGGVFWVRRGTHTVPLSLSEMLELANDRGLQDWEVLPARGATMEDIDMVKVEAYLQQRSTRGRQAGRFEDIERVLLGMKCAVRTGSGDVVPTNAGLLFFGHEPQLHIIQSEVTCVLYRDAAGASRYADRKFIRGTTQELIDGTTASRGFEDAGAARAAEERWQERSAALHVTVIGFWLSGALLYCLDALKMKGVSSPFCLDLRRLFTPLRACLKIATRAVRCSEESGRIDEELRCTPYARITLCERWVLHAGNRYAVDFSETSF